MNKVPLPPGPVSHRLLLSVGEVEVDQLSDVAQGPGQELHAGLLLGQGLQEQHVEQIGRPHGRAALQQEGALGHHRVSDGVRLVPRIVRRSARPLFHDIPLEGYHHSIGNVSI